MKKRKTLCLLALVLLFAAVGLFSACSSKDGKITLSFETNGGEKIESVKVEKGAEFELPTPTKEGYSFEGWYTDKEFGGSAVTKVTATENMTFYAKWEQLYTVTLDANGGTLSANSLKLKAGANLAEALKGITVTPKDNDHQFGAWFNGATAIGASDVMLASDMNLVAKYKVRCTIHVYCQNIDDDEYTKQDIENYYDYAGATPSLDMDGFEFDAEHTGTVLGAISENVANNEFTVYYNRNAAVITLYPNYPGEESDFDNYATINTKFGASIKLPTTQFAKEGYALVGWNEDGSDNITYASSYIYDALFNKDNKTAPENYVVSETNVSLYAVWAAGSVDIFGGSDLIYHINEADTEIYLCRNDIFFAGRYIASNGTFIFEPTQGVTIAGKLNDNGTFVYRDQAKSDDNYTLFENNAVNDKVKLYMDAYNGVTYTVTEDGAEQSSKGSYTLDSSSGEILYVVKFEDNGPVAGQTLTIRLDNTNNYFFVRNEEEYAIGMVYMFVDDENYSPTYYQILFTGFGTVLYNTPNGTAIFTCQKEDKEGEYYTFYNNMGGVAGKIVIVDKGEIKGYYLIDEEHQHTYESADKKESLELDGMYTATYTKDGRKMTGQYSIVSTTLYAGNFVVMTVGNTNYNFIINNVPSGTDEEVTYTYTLRSMLSTYGELMFVHSDGKMYRYPLLALDEEEQGKVSIYGIANNAYVKIATAKYVINSEDGKGVVSEISTTEDYDGSVYLWDDETVFGVELGNIESFVFGMVSNSSARGFYVYSIQEKGKDPTNYEKQYIDAANNETLTLVACFAYYTFTPENANAPITVFGSFTRSSGSNLVTVSTSSGTLRFEVNEDDSTFICLKDFYGTLYGVDEDGNRDSSKTLVFDGKGGVVYNDRSDSANPKTYSGKYSISEKTTVFGEEYYIFTATEEDYTFNFMIYSTSSYSIFVRYLENTEKTFGMEIGTATLQLDGFAHAKYTTEDGVVHDGVYFYNENGGNPFIMANFENGIRYFDLKGDKFTLRGTEYLDLCLWYDNCSIRELHFSLDGYGKLTVYNNEGEEVATGEYTYENDQYKFTYTYKDGGEPETLYGTIGVVTMGDYSYPALIVEHKNFAGSYVDTKDWTILTLDSISNATKTDNTGKTAKGQYLIITDELIYYWTSATANIYAIDSTNHTITPYKFEETYGYYTTDFEAINFSAYGYGYMLGERIYFTVGDDGSVTIYRSPKEGEEANAYGFVTDKTFGKFEDKQKTIDGKVYYRSTGYSISFVRQEEDPQNCYPVPVSNGEKSALLNLVFTPINNGEKSGEFRANASLTIGREGNVYNNCTVVREVNDDETVEFYIMLPTTGIGYFRFDIEVNYRGDEAGAAANSYKITNMRVMREVDSFMYLNYAFMIMYQLGPAYLSFVPNTLGYANIYTEYDIAGDAQGMYLDATFGALDILGILNVDSGVRDYNGNYLEFKHVPVVYDEDSRCYVAEIQGKDDYTYVMRMDIQSFQLLGTYGFVINALTRKQVLDVKIDGADYRVEVERVLVSDSIYIEPGSILNVRLLSKTDGENADEDGYEYVLPDLMYLDANGQVVYIVREREEETITSTTYYYIQLNLNIPPVKEGDNVYVPVEYYTSAEVTKKQMTTVYNSDGTAFADIDSDNKIVLFVIGRTYYLVSECDYDAASQTYHVTTTGNRKYDIVKGVDGKLTFTEIVPQE